MGCSAQESVLDLLPKLQMLLAAGGTSQHDAAARMQEVSLRYAEKRQRERTDPLAMKQTMEAERHEQMQRQEVGMKERRTALDARERALAARERKAQQREAELASLKADWEKVAAELHGQAHALVERGERERQRQAERFRTDMGNLAAERDQQVTALRAQLAEVEAKYHEDVADLHASKQDLEAELESAFGAQEQEGGWREELRSREDVLSAQHAVLGEREQELARLQDGLKEEQAQLEQRRAEFDKEREALKQLRGNSTDLLQKSGGQVRKVREVRVHELRFSQNNVGRCFQDGRRLDETVRKLRRGEVAANDFGRLRVVSYMDMLWSLDNRRLRCLKEAFPERTHADTTVTVQLEPLTDKTIAREFQKKFTVGKTVEQRR